MKDFASPMPAHPPSSRIYYMLNKVGYIFGKKKRIDTKIQIEDLARFL